MLGARTQTHNRTRAEWMTTELLKNEVTCENMRGLVIDNGLDGGHHQSKALLRHSGRETHEEEIKERVSG